ncbi:MAG: zinc-dependent metalloprotease [Pseudobdellovibrio sp.]
MKRQLLQTIKFIALLALISACTKTRKAELPEDQQSSVFAITEFGNVAEDSQFSASITSSTQESLTSNSIQAVDFDSKIRLFAHEVNVPSRMKFMFDNLPLTNLQNREFKIIFSVDKEYITSYKIATDVNQLSILEKSIAFTAKEVQLITKAGKVNAGQAKALTNEQKTAQAEKEAIKKGQAKGTLLVPLFKYKISGYGTLARVKNELKEETSRLELKNSEWKDATHITLSDKTDSRLVIGMGVEQIKQLKQVFSEDKLDNQIMTAKELQERLSVGMKFMNPETPVFTRLDTKEMFVYEITTQSKLDANMLRVLKNNGSNQQVLSCQDESVAKFIKSTDKECVIILMAQIPIAYKEAKLTEENELGSSSQRIELKEVQKGKSVGLVEIRENTAASQANISATSGLLDPDSTIKLSDIKGEFFYRRTFEAASNMFLGRTGTSGDMTIIRFELEDDRIVVRNQQSLITYTGQGPKDREELMSFPVTYFRLDSTDAMGNKLTMPAFKKTTKQDAEYARIDWTNNTIPDSNSPLAFYAGGACFAATSSLKVTDTDMRLATAGVLNYSLSGSYTVRPEDSCVATKDVNSAYWGGSYQFNFNITERISFMKHSNAGADVQFAQNISSMAQAAFNFGVFTLADKVTENGTLANRDGSEKYMPIIHDFRNGRKLKYHLGGINNKEVTSPERRKLLVDATNEVIKEWNDTLKISFRGTSLQRDGDYVELVVDENSDGHLGDLDRNYIWLQELPAENGLLGVAQPAANPRSGTIMSANVIVYTGNTFNQTEALLKITKISRQYEKDIAEIKAKAIAQAKVKAEADAAAKKAADAAGDKGSDLPAADGSQDVVKEVQKSKINLNKALEAMQLDNARIQQALLGMKTSKNSKALKTILTRDVFKNDSKGQDVKYAVNKDTFLKHLADLAVKKDARNNPNEFELEVNKAFIDFGGLDENVKVALKRRSQLLDAAIRFDKATKNRPGCFTYSRDDINDEAQLLDKDPKVNLMLNFKKNVKSTLSHELGHAFGLLHNFIASTDKANYEFKNTQGVAENTGRNYSSIMDYIADIDMKYNGPGPYDAHAIRAAYTGMVEVASDAVAKALKDKAVIVSEDNLISTTEVVTKLAGRDSLVHFTKDTVNKAGIFKHYAQCDDTNVGQSVLCARFDSGGSATEIVQNLINDYHRGYVNRNYVYDKILFGWSQKAQIINRNIALFQNIRSFLDESIMSLQYGTGLPKARSNGLIIDEIKAAKMGYQFFHELVRIPDAEGMPVMTMVDVEGSTTKVLRANPERFIAVPYKFTNEAGEEVNDFKVIESRSVSDIGMARDKMNTIGITYDKAFAMLFLLQATPSQVRDDSNNSSISYLDFEQALMGIENPAQSPTMNLILDVLQNNVSTVFYAPSNNETKAELTQDEFNAEVGNFRVLQAKPVNLPVSVPLLLARQTSIGATIGLAQSKWRSFDAFAETFKVSKSTNGQAPKDRPNVAKLGQDKTLDDTKVLFASQNAIGSSVLVNNAARNEYYMLNKNNLFRPAMIAIYNADAKYKVLIGKLFAAACADEKSEACQALIAKDEAQIISENADIAAEKTKADEVAQAFVAKLRELNTSGLIIDKELDAEDSPINLEVQVAQLREILSSQIRLILVASNKLKNAEEAQIEEVIKEVLGQVKPIKEANAELESVHLFAVSFMVMNDIGTTIKIEMKNGDKLDGSVIAGLMMNTTKLKDDLEIQLPVIEDLAMYSNAVDADTVGR